MLVYLSTAVDKANGEFLAAEEILSKAKIGSLDAVFFLPYRAFQPSSKAIDPATAQAIKQANDRVLETADVIVIVYSKGVETWGCPWEIIKARDLSKRIYLLTQSTDFPLPVYLTLHLRSVPCFFSVHALLREIEDQEYYGFRPKAPLSCDCGYLGDPATFRGEHHLSSCEHSMPF